MTPSAPARFPKTARVRSPAQYRRVFENARRVHHPAFTLHVAPPAPADEGATLGLAVSRKVDPHAVGRNRIKRVLRDAFRRHRALMAARALVVVAKPAAAKLDNAMLASAFLDTLRRAGALPRPDATGTMRGDFPLQPPGPRDRPDTSMPE